MTIHREHPFLPPPERRDAARQFRGRLVSPVTLWLTGEGRQRAGLTVSSTMVALGDEPAVLGLLDPDADLTERLDTVTVTVLTPADHALADAFGGVAPAPGGPFRQAEFVPTPWGPRLAVSRTWLGARVVQRRTVGWSTEVWALIEHVDLADQEPLGHVRGRYTGSSGRADAL